MTAPLPPPAAGPDDDQAQQIAFGRCVLALSRTMRTAPLGWGLVAWAAWGRVPQANLLAWLALAATGWLISLGLLALIRREGMNLARHQHWLQAAAAIDGAWWGAVIALLAGNDAALNAFLGAVLCGVAAVNAPVYVTRIHVFYALCAALWLTALTGLLRLPGRAMLDIALGLAVFLGLLCYFMHGVATRVVEGIRLQLANAALTVQLSEALAAMEHQAATDALTGLPNRRSLDQALAAQLALARREGRPLSLLMLDLDRFKAVNDTHGHGVGDAVLRAFAQRVQAQLRPSDVCARYGGEEFVVLLSGTKELLAVDAADRLRRAVADGPLVPGVAITVSVGLATWRDEDAAALLARADAALYAAKRGGRNRVIAG
ncbi:GGDEF domain-containing protein [Roseateles asaccharophilus]|uniref:diguanylate cyclase n=1 Tax=Roseateles asaccharophilus TaxID=582607 RepID=A0ABU2AEI4_9BURK|nr:GGDEF domain-containing protein [Roseateles asaccharophilus]MDR7335390.1 diguanylate cyclase (GGDEF)-like protein [Roseateles asaccharophilus]